MKRLRMMRFMRVNDVFGVAGPSEGVMEAME